MQRQARVPHAGHEERHLVMGECDRTGHLFEIVGCEVQGFVVVSANTRSDAIGKSKICILLRNMKTLNVSIDSRDQDPPVAIDELRHHLNEVSHGLEYHPSKHSGVQIFLRTGDYDFKGSQAAKTICQRGNCCAQPIVIALHENELMERGVKRMNEATHNANGINTMKPSSDFCFFLDFFIKTCTPVFFHSLKTESQVHR